MSDSVRPHRRQSTGSPVPGILQAQHWSGLPFASPMHESEKWKWSRLVLSDYSLSPSQTWTAAYQAPPSMGFSRQEYWSGVPLLCCRQEHLLTVDSKVLLQRWEVKDKPGDPAVLGQRLQAGSSPYLLNGYSVPGLERGDFPRGVGRFLHLS